MSWDYINKNHLNKGNSVKGGEKFKELMKDPEWYKDWLEKTKKASHTPEKNASRSKKIKEKFEKDGNWWVGREHTSETKAKMSESAHQLFRRRHVHPVLLPEQGACRDLHQLHAL